MAIRDDLAEILAGDLNKKFKGSKVAYFLDGSDQTPTDVDDFISTGSDMLDLMREHFECVDDNTETFIIGHNLTTDEAVELIESILTPEILETMREIKRPKIKKINYEVGTLYGKEDIRDLRPTCDFLTGEDAQITTEAGAGERYRSVYMYMDKYLKKLDRPIKMSASAKAHKIIRMAKHTAKREIEIEQLKEKEKQGQGVLF